MADAIESVGLGYTRIPFAQEGAAKAGGCSTPVTATDLSSATTYRQRAKYNTTAIVYRA